MVAECAREKTLERVDSELQEVARSLPQLELSSATIETTRQMFSAGTTALVEDDAACVTTHSELVPPFADGPPVPVTIYEPVGAYPRRAVILDIHGGGFVFGSASMNDVQNRRLAKELNVFVVSVDYRLAPENPYPASLEDCLAAFRWIRTSENFSSVTERVIVLGNSAGGGLAASLCLWLLDRNERLPITQILLSPMLNDRTCLRPTCDDSVHVGWNMQNNRFGWESLLGRPPGGDLVSPFASPARASSLTGLPPTFISVGSLDLFADEDVEFGRRLINDGVATELHVYPGAFHGFVRFAPEARVSLGSVSDVLAAIDYQLEL